MVFRRTLVAGLVSCMVTLVGCSDSSPTLPQSGPVTASQPETPTPNKDPSKTVGSTRQSTSATAKAPALAKAGSGAVTPEVPFEGRRIALIHTANVVGELEPCG